MQFAMANFGCFEANWVVKLSAPKTSVSGLEVLGGENIVNGVYAKLF